MRARNFDNVLTDFTPAQVMHRNLAIKQGPRLPGVGLAQWTSRDRRAGLFEHAFQGRRLGASILYDMDAQVDYLVAELGSHYRNVDRVLRNPNVSLNAASDEVVYNYEIPGSILSAPADDGRRRKLPRSDPAVLEVFNRRRRYSRDALQIYRTVHP
jgi:hypothetical protein